MKMSQRIIICTLLLTLTSCNYVANKTGYKKVEEARAEIAKIEEAGRKAVEAKEIEIKNKLTEVIDKQGVQIQKSANSLYAASLTRPLYPEETRVVILTFNRIDEAKSALGLPPTLEAMKVEQERLVKELDEKQTSLTDLKKEHEKVVSANEILVTATKLSKEQVDLLEAEKVKIANDSKDAIIAEGKKLSTLQDKLLDAEGIKKAQLAYIEQNKRLFMAGLGILSVAALFIGLYLPLFKKQAFTFSAICGGGAIAVLFMQPWHFTIVFIIAILLGLYFIFRKVGVVSQSASNVINSVQEFKEKHSEKYESLRPILEEYNKTYTKDGKVEDVAATGYIKEVLRDYEKI